MILWLLNKRLCSETSAFYYAHIGFPLANALMGASVWIVVFLTMSQYMAVCHPFNHGYIRKRKTCFWLFAIAYIFNFCIYAPWATKKRIFLIPHGLMECPYVICDRPKEMWFIVYEWIREFSTRVFPFILIAYFNVKILITYRNTKRDRMLRLTYSSHTRLLSEKSEQEEKRLFVLLFAIIIVFFVCTIPAAPLTIFVADKRSENLSFQIIRAVINLMEFTKFALNFYFYCLINPDIRRICLYIIQCRKSNAKVARVKGQPVNPISLYTRSSKSRGLTPVSGVSRRNSQNENGGTHYQNHQNLFLRTRSASMLTSVLGTDTAVYDQLTVIKESDDSSDPARESNSPLSVGESLENPRKNSDEENGCAFYCFLVPNQTEKIDQNKELEPYKNLSCTHLVYAFAHVDNRSWTVAGPTLWDTPDVEWEGNYKAVASLHEWSNMTVLLGIFQSGKLSFIASPWSREKFAKEVVKAARWHNFQGIFFYFQSGEHFEESQFLEFLETLKHELDSDAETIRGQRDGRLQVVLSIGSKSVTKSSEKFPKIEPYFDGFYLIMDDSPPPNENHSLASQIDPLFATSGNQTIASEETISFIAEEIVESGIPRHKLIIGLNVWTNSFVLDNPNITGHGAKVISQGNASVTGKTDGKLAYFEICDLKNASEIEYDDIAETTSFSADDSWFSLNIPGHPSFEKKLNWIAKNKFGGVGLASLKADDQDGKCGEGPFPVHNYVGKHFRCPWSNDETDEDNNKPTVCTRLCIIRPENAPNEFSLSNMEPQWCSHIVISSAKILSLPGSLYLSDKMKQLVDDYKQWDVEGKPKLIISIGAHEIPDNWRVYLFTRYRRQILIDSIKKVLLDTEAEGVDISWTRGHLDSAKDTEIFILFVEELKKQIGQQFLIFVEVTPQSTFNERYDFVRMNRYHT
uniref:Uncharacterized protein n=1 Tax=Acrobeloides nanus TaxID=290746 RepID=A0A914DQK1_9BILA